MRDNDVAITGKEHDNRCNCKKWFNQRLFGKHRWSSEGERKSKQYPTRNEGINQGGYIIINLYDVLYADGLKHHFWKNSEEVSLQVECGPVQER